MKKILLLGTGGTIASVQGKDGLTPGIRIAGVLDYRPELRSLCQADTLDVCSIDSTSMTPEIWRSLALTLKERWAFYDGFVICHGTDTLAYTAAALSYMIQDPDKPVVLTGSQKPINVDMTDAGINLADSFAYALDSGSRGVSIVFGGKVIVGTRGRKERARSFNAFSSLNFPYPAVVRDGLVTRFFEEARPAGPVRFYTELSGHVLVLKLVPGLDPGLLPLLFSLCDALVLESYGVGGIPDYLAPAFREEMARWGGTKMVVVATQVPREGSDMTIYEVGRQVKRDFRLMEAYDMTLEAVVTKLMWLMGRQGLDSAARRREFCRTINHDVLFAGRLED